MHHLLITLLRRQTILWEGGGGAELASPARGFQWALKAWKYHRRRTPPPPPRRFIETGLSNGIHFLSSSLSSAWGMGSSPLEEGVRPEAQGLPGWNVE